MKRSNTALMAFIGMMGIASANQFSLSSQETIYSGYRPSSIQILELGNLFTNHADENHDAPRMSYKAFATMLKNFEINPEDNKCSTHDDGDFYDAFMGNGCSGGEPNFSEPHIIRCDGVVVYCADVGKKRHFDAHQSDGYPYEALSTRQFRQAIESLNTELDTENNGFIYKTLTDPGIAANGVISATYELIEVFGYDGQEGNDGYYRQEITSTYGTTDHLTLTRKITSKAEGQQRWVYEGQTGGIDGKVTYDFSSVFDNITRALTTIDTVMIIFFNVPNYIYEQKVTLEFGDGSMSQIYGGLYISNTLGGEAFRRKVIFNEDGTIEEAGLICSRCGL